LHNKLVKHLLFQTCWGNSEVKNGDLNLSLRRVTGVRKVSGHEEFEVIVPRNDLVTHSDGARFIDLLEEDGLESGVDIFSHVLNEDPLTKLDGDFEVSHESGVLGLENINSVGAEFQLSGQTLDKLACLVLRINHERPSSRFKHDQGVLNGQVVRRQVVCSPSLSHDWVLKHSEHGAAFLHFNA
jgi:hypothetical protein